MGLISLLVSNLGKSVWSVLSISRGVLELEYKLSTEWILRVGDYTQKKHTVNPRLEVDL